VLPGDEAALLKGAVVRVAGLPHGGGVRGDAGDPWSEKGPRAFIVSTDGDVVANLED
jgi:hypothetical protein